MSYDMSYDVISMAHTLNRPRPKGNQSLGVGSHRVIAETGAGVPCGLGAFDGPWTSLSHYHCIINHIVYQCLSYSIRLSSDLQDLRFFVRPSTRVPGNCQALQICSRGKLKVMQETDEEYGMVPCVIQHCRVMIRICYCRTIEWITTVMCRKAWLPECSLLMLRTSGKRTSGKTFWRGAGCGWI